MQPEQSVLATLATHHVLPESQQWVIRSMSHQHVQVSINALPWSHHQIVSLNSLCQDTSVSDKTRMTVEWRTLFLILSLGFVQVTIYMLAVLYVFGENIQRQHSHRGRVVLICSSFYWQFVVLTAQHQLMPVSNRNITNRYVIHQQPIQNRSSSMKPSSSKWKPLWTVFDPLAPKHRSVVLLIRRLTTTMNMKTSVYHGLFWTVAMNLSWQLKKLGRRQAHTSLMLLE